MSEPANPKDPSCWVCGAQDAEVYKTRSIERELESSDLLITDSNYGATLGLRQCRKCSFIYAEGDDLQELFGLYEALADPGYEESQDTRILQMEWLLDRACAAHPGAKTLLDVGAAAGLLVKLAQDRGLEASGVEPSKELVGAAKRIHGVELIQGTTNHSSLAGRTFDIVFLADVIEHVGDPVGLLEDARKLLAPGGVMVVVTPDAKSIAKKLLGKRWWHFRLAHVCYFDKKTFQMAAERAGLRIQQRFRAKWFFHVSYLAVRLERYLPLSPFLWILRSTRLGKAVGSTVIPLNLFDSWAFCLREPK